MQSQFRHQHAVDYMIAWVKLENFCAFKSKNEQIDILEMAKQEIAMQAALRAMEIGSRDVSLTEIEAAQLAAIEEHLTRRNAKPDEYHKVVYSHIVRIGN